MRLSGTNRPRSTASDTKTVENAFLKGPSYKYFESSFYSQSPRIPLLNARLPQKAVIGAAILGFAASAAVLLSSAEHPLTGFSVAELAQKSMSSISGMFALIVSCVSAGILAVEFIISKTQWPGADISRPSEQEHRTELLMSRAEEALDRGHHRKALAIYDDILSKDPHNSRALLNKGFVYDEIGEYRTALQAYDRMLETDPWNAKALYNRGMTLLEMEKKTEAEDCFSRALHVDPANIPALRKICFIMFSRKEYAKAVRFCDRALDIDEKNIDMTIIKGLALERSGKGKKALEQYEKALSIDPKDVRAFKCRYNLLKKLKTGRK